MAAETNATGQPGPVIDKLLDFFVANDGTAYYQVKWKPTWERADALLQFTDLVDTFWKFVNNAHTGNLYNNQSMHKGPDPILPSPLPPQINVQTAPKSTSKSTPGTPKQRKNSTPNVQQKSNTSSTPQRKQTPLKTPTKPPVVAAVIIDSDDEDIAEVTTPSNSIVSSLQNMPGNNVMTSMPMQQQQFPMNPMWNVQPKTEPVDIPDQKPFQGNQQNFDMNNFNQPPQLQQQPQPPQQQFQFPMQNVTPSPNGRGRGRGRGGRGRGGGDTPGAKRKAKEPATVTSNKLPNTVKMENPDEMNSPHMFNLSDSSPSNDNFGGYDVSESSPSNDNSGGKWEDTFEIIEKKNFDGNSLETQYKCTICSTVISNRGSCRRHYNIHSGQKSYKCPICDKAFHRLDYMQRHLKIHGHGGGKELEGLIKLAMESVKK